MAIIAAHSDRLRRARTAEAFLCIADWTRYRNIPQLPYSWMKTYALSEYYRPIPEPGDWLRRRVPICCIKQWPKRRTRIKRLLSLGVPREKAISIGLSSKGWWRLSRTYASQLGIDNAWLERQGLVSIKELWVAFHCGRGPRRGTRPTG